MKTIISILFLAALTCQAQTKSDSLQIRNIQLNLQRAHQIHQYGTLLHAAGAWANVISFTGYKLNYMDKKQFESGLIIGCSFHVAAQCVILYSHKFVGRAGLRVGPTGFIYNF